MQTLIFAFILMKGALQQYGSDCSQLGWMSTKCDYCYNSTSYSQTGVASWELKCGCYSSKFSSAGICFSLKENCHSYNEYSDESRNTVILPFWDQKFTEARTTQPDPNPLPDFLNNFDFSYTNYREWIQAYYLYKVFESDILAKTAVQQHQLLFAAVDLVQSTRNSTLQQKWTAYTSFVNSNLGQTYSLQQLLDRINGTLKTVIPCQCYGTYGAGLINSADFCIRCPPNCYTCSNNATTCTQCISRYLLNSAGVCELCPLANCEMCNSDGTCNYTQGCPANQRDAGGSCVPCSENC